MRSQRTRQPITKHPTRFTANLAVRIPKAGIAPSRPVFLPAWLRAGLTRIFHERPTAKGPKVRDIWSRTGMRPADVLAVRRGAKSEHGQRLRTCGSCSRVLHEISGLRPSVLLVPMARAFVLALFVIIAGYPAQAAEREFPTLLALGGAWPLQSEEGVFTPVVVVDHESDFTEAQSKLQASLRTSTIRFAYRFPIAHPVHLRLASRYTFISKGDGGALYHRGERQDAASFEGDEAAAMLALQLSPEGRYPVSFQWEGSRTWFRPTEYTAAGYTLPKNYSQQEFSLRLEATELLEQEEASLALTLSEGRRTNWENWSLDSNALEKAEYRKQTLVWKQPYAWSDPHQSSLTMQALGGDNLDLFSGYAIGGFGGDYTVAGYYRNEFRAKSALVVNLDHEWAFSEDRKLTLLADYARLEALAPEAPWASLEQHTMAGVGVGFYYGIRSLSGLPVIVRYGEALLVPDESPEDHRRELLLVVAAGF